MNFVFSESTKKRKPELSDDAYSEKRSRKSEDKTSPTSASQGKRDKKSERKRVSTNLSLTPENPSLDYHLKKKSRSKIKMRQNINEAYCTHS